MLEHRPSEWVVSTGALSECLSTGRVSGWLARVHCESTHPSEQGARIPTLLPPSEIGSLGGRILLLFLQ
jgi:hypothetical protein